MNVNPSPAAVTASAQWLADLRRAAGPKIAWLWQGYLAAGNITLLTSQWKTGKTTLVSILLHQLKTGGQLAGLPVQPGKAIVISEECPELWLERAEHFDYAEHVCWFCRPFLGKPTREQWLDLGTQILTLHQQVTCQLLVIDPLALFLPGRDENSAATMVEFLAPLQRLAAAGLAILLLHHPRKKAHVAGAAARGSGALTGFADILLEMHFVGAPSDDDRRRQLLGWSRHRVTPRQLVLELDPSGTTYTALGNLEDATLAELHPTLLSIFQTANGKLTVRQILDSWPPDQHRSEPALYKWLARGLRDGLLVRDNNGTKSEPHRYWLPAREQQWLQDPLYRLMEEEEKICREVSRRLDERR